MRPTRWLISMSRTEDKARAARRYLARRGIPCEIEKRIGGYALLTEGRFIGQARALRPERQALERA
jgi:hypothetical protein